jgi:hypothetical protein
MNLYVFSTFQLLNREIDIHSFGLGILYIWIKPFCHFRIWIDIHYPGFYISVLYVLLAINQL